MIVYFLELPILPAFISLAGKSRLKLLIYVVIFFALVTGLRILQRKRNIFPKIAIETPFLTSFISLCFAVVFYFRWADSQRMWYVSKAVHLPQQMACAMIALFLALLSLPGIDYAVRILHMYLPDKKQFRHDRIVVMLFIFLTAVAVMFLNSRSSPLYPFNDWMDPNTMFTVGKGVLKGYVPYRDLYEQKGPLLIFLHTIGAAISYTSFIGIWFFELIACFCYLYFLYKTMALFFGNKACIAIPLIALITYSPYAFLAGDSAEEYSLAFLSYALYVGCKALLNRNLPSGREFFLIGLTSGIIFWSKYSLTGFYAGWFLYFLIFSIMRKQLEKLLKGVLTIISGIIIVTVPVFVYFIANDAIDSLLQVYFYNNLFYYSEVSLTFAQKMQVGINTFRRFAPFAMIFCGTGVLWLVFRKRWKLMVFLFMAFLGTFIFINIGGIYHIYTSLILTIFSLSGTFWLLELCHLIPQKPDNPVQRLPGISAVSLVACLFFLCRLSHNMHYLQYKEDEMFQYQIKSVIESSNIENPTILHYQVAETGINTVTGSIPGIRFFCSYNNDKIGVLEEQEQCIKNQCADFIITLSREEEDHPTFETYDYQGWRRGLVDKSLHYCHYYTPRNADE